jgi:transcriptional antiterminator RfaH
VRVKLANWHGPRSLPKLADSVYIGAQLGLWGMGLARRTINYWTAAITRWSQEQRAAHHVERQGFQFHLPVTQVLSPKGTPRTELLFPGYIFVKIKRGWETLSSTRGISRLFMCDGRPTRIPDHVMKALRQREDEDGIIRIAPELVVGERVRVKTGAFEHCLGKVCALPARMRVSVLLDLLGRQVQTELDRRVVEAA